MCKYCGTDHDLIGDVVCPILKRFPESYSTKKVFNDTWPSVLEVDWPAQQHDFTKVPDHPDIDEKLLRTFKDYCNSISEKAGFIIPQNGTYQGTHPQ